MSKIVPQFEVRSWPSDLPLHSQHVAVLVPYDAKTGKVYLNACGADEQEVAFALSAIGMPDDQRSHMKTASATLDFSDSAALQSSLFPVCVPVHVGTGKVHLGGIGSNEIEADANLSFSNVDVDQYRIVTAMMRMPPPSLEFEADENLLPRSLVCNFQPLEYVNIIPEFLLTIPASLPKFRLWLDCHGVGGGAISCRFQLRPLTALCIGLPDVEDTGGETRCGDQLVFH